jgi:hypothetical protein
MRLTGGVACGLNTGYGAKMPSASDDLHNLKRLQLYLNSSKSKPVIEGTALMLAF